MADVAVDLRFALPDGSVYESIEGVEFISQPHTPFLLRALEQASGALSTALAGRAGVALSLSLSRHEPVHLANRYVVFPDLLLRDGDRPLLVVELRADSTDRYALGIKRLAYETARIPEYWFVEPRHGLVRVLRLQANGRTYAWPPETYGMDDEIELRELPGVSIAVRSLFVDRLPVDRPTTEEPEGVHA